MEVRSRHTSEETVACKGLSCHWSGHRRDAIHAYGNAGTRREPDTEPFDACPICGRDVDGGPYRASLLERAAGKSV